MQPLFLPNAMKQFERSLAFFSALLITFGLTALELDNPAFEYNQRAYYFMIAGAVLLIVFAIIRIQRQRKL
jgi:hypothetical protein